MDDLAGKLELYWEHPSAMVEEMFGIKPDAWQHKVFEAFPHNPTIAMMACSGPGKTFVLAMLGINFLITRQSPKIGAISYNKSNLEAGLWPELNRWYYKSPYLQKTFEIQATEIHARDPSLAENWKLEKRTWAKDANAEQVGEALRGLHAPNVMWLADEMGGAPRQFCQRLKTSSLESQKRRISCSPAIPRRALASSIAPA